MNRLHETLTKAQPDMLKEIIRNAESYLATQLTVVLASNQRAMAFTSMLGIVTAALVGAGLSLLLSKLGDWQLGVLSMLLACTMLFAMKSSMKAFSPGAFEYCGNQPCHWLDDIKENKPIHVSLAEQAAHYDEMIAHNSTVLKDQGKSLKSAMSISWWSLLVGGIFATAHVVGIYLS